MQIRELVVELLLLLDQVLAALLEDEDLFVCRGFEDLFIFLYEHIVSLGSTRGGRGGGGQTDCASTRILSMAPQTAPEMMTVAKRPVIVYRFQRGQAAMPLGEGVVVVGFRGSAGEGWCGWRTGAAFLGVGLGGLMKAAFLVGGGGDGGAIVGGGCPSSPLLLTPHSRT